MDKLERESKVEEQNTIRVPWKVWISGKLDDLPDGGRFDLMFQGRTFETIYVDYLKLAHSWKSDFPNAETELAFACLRSVRDLFCCENKYSLARHLAGEWRIEKVDVTVPLTVWWATFDEDDRYLLEATSS